MEAILLAVLIACAAVIAVLVWLYERELRHMAHFLKQREQGSNERISVEFATRGIREVASAMNDELDALRDARIEQEQHQAAFQRDLASLSHDIRTPLAGAQGYLQLHERTQDPIEQQRCLTEAAARLGVMRDLTDKLFEYTKAIDADSILVIEEVEVFPALAQVLAGMYPQFAERKWSPEIHFKNENLAVMADADALSRIFSNLLTNALRYGNGAPRITQYANVVTVINSVEHPEVLDLDHIFDRFYQGESARTSDGSGLGLAIVASLCKHMGGSVSAQLQDNELSIAVSFRLN